MRFDLAVVGDGSERDRARRGPGRHRPGHRDRHSPAGRRGAGPARRGRGGRGRGRGGRAAHHRAGPTARAVGSTDPGRVAARAFEAGPRVGRACPRIRSTGPCSRRRSRSRRSSP
jgi:hypothetical protein